MDTSKAGEEGWKSWLPEKKSDRVVLSLTVVSIVTSLIVGYMQYQGPIYLFGLEKSFEPNDVAFQVPAMERISSNASPTATGVTPAVPLRMRWRVVLQNRGNRQIAVYRMAPLVQYAKEPARFKAMYEEGNPDTEGFASSQLVEGGKAAIIDLKVAITATAIGVGRMPIAEGTVVPPGSTHKIAGVVCFGTIASNGVKLTFSRQVAWLYFGETNNYRGAIALNESIPLEAGDKASDCSGIVSDFDVPNPTS